MLTLIDTSQTAAVQTPATDQAAADGGFQRPDDYCAQRSHVYPSADSFRWFVRKHRAELVEAGALICPTGRWIVRPEAFDRVVVAVGLRRAKREA